MSGTKGLGAQFDNALRHAFRFIQDAECEVAGGEIRERHDRGWVSLSARLGKSLVDSLLDPSGTSVIARVVVARRQRPHRG
jgi:hypothetical protein